MNIAPTIVPGTCTTCAPRIAQLEAERDAAEFCQIWGIYKREGLERRLTQLGPGYVAIVLDIDKMHDANETYTQDGVDWRIAQIMARVRTDDTYAGRWKRGDEVVLFCNETNAEGLAIRLLVAFEMYGMGATITITLAAREAIDAGITAIGRAKKAGQRGEILEATV